MRTEVILLLGAEIDFANLYQRFGSKFYEALDKALGRLADFPEAGPVYHGAIGGSWSADFQWVSSMFRAFNEP